MMQHRSTTTFGGRTRVMAATLAALSLAVATRATASTATNAAVAPASSDSTASPAPAVSQDPAEAIMVAAGTWALDRLPQGTARLDPHRSGAGKDGDRIARVARTLRVELGTLDATRQCTDTMDPSTCSLGVVRLITIGAPRIDGDRAQVRVHAWYRSGSAGEPVAQDSWNLQLRRGAQGWTVVSGG